MNLSDSLTDLQIKHYRCDIVDFLDEALSTGSFLLFSFRILARCWYDASKKSDYTPTPPCVGSVCSRSSQQLRLSGAFRLTLPRHPRCEQSQLGPFVLIHQLTIPVSDSVEKKKIGQVGPAQIYGKKKKT